MPSKFSQTWRFRYAFGIRDHRPVPIRRVAQAFGNDLGAVVFTVERLRINVIVDQRGKHGAWNRGRIPAASVEARGSNLLAGLRRIRHILQLPAARRESRTAVLWQPPWLQAHIQSASMPRQRCKNKNGTSGSSTGESFFFLAIKTRHYAGDTPHSVSNTPVAAEP